MYRVRMHTPSFPSLFAPKYVHNARSVLGGNGGRKDNVALIVAPLPPSWIVDAGRDPPRNIKRREKIKNGVFILFF